MHDDAIVTLCFVRLFRQIKVVDAGLESAGFVHFLIRPGAILLVLESALPYFEPGKPGKHFVVQAILKFFFNGRVLG